ncbi:MAG: hypothetical protein DMF20_11540 [Verrucomicrobia bacterium]|nr:MAG: hypothetical protein DMF20_11540 [Verrucomicrobiota bacterium]
MNGSEPNIEIFKPFGEAFELMKKILFQPFDLKKWFIIGFAAWLANLGRGGVSFNYQFNRREEAQKVKEAISQIPHPILVLGISLLVVFGLVLIVLFSWLRARGGFMFIDCLVKNRAVIAEPWREFRKEGNSYFLFSLVVTFVLIVFAALLALPLIVLAFKGRYFLHLHRDRLDLYVILIIAAWIFVILLVIIAWALIASFMVPVMYRRPCDRDWIDQLFRNLCYVLHRRASYIGTVILLPVFILFRSFSLVFLRQFGPDYDVWVTFMPPEFAPALSGMPRMPLATQPPNLPPEPPSSPVG